MVAVSTMAIFAAIAVPSYQAHLRKLKVTTATTDILVIAAAVNRYTDLNNSVPPDLATVFMDKKVDPWGQPYIYFPFTDVKGKGKMRKDKNLVPINTQYDLYSVGEDGRTVPPLTAKVSRDDIIQANDGNYVGLASDY
jgi:general secretion pathway protein G